MVLFIVLSSSVFGFVRCRPIRVLYKTYHQLPSLLYVMMSFHFLSIINSTSIGLYLSGLRIWSFCVKLYSRLYYSKLNKNFFSLSIFVVILIDSTKIVISCMETSAQ